MQPSLRFLSFCLFLLIGLAVAPLAAEAPDRHLQFALLLGGLNPGGDQVKRSEIQLAQAAITVSPSIVDTGTTSEVTISAPGTFDLGAVQESQISLRPVSGVSNLRIVWATAQQMRLSLTLSDAAEPGVRSLLIKDSAGATIVALDIALRLGPSLCRPACQAHQTCSNNVCIGCDPPCADGESCVGTICRPITPPPPPVCRPACRPPKVCNDVGQCEIPQ
jgi:hypothetical protein